MVDQAIVARGAEFARVNAVGSSLPFARPSSPDRGACWRCRENFRACPRSAARQRRAHPRRIRDDHRVAGRCQHVSSDRRGLLGGADWLTTMPLTPGWRPQGLGCGQYRSLITTITSRRNPPRSVIIDHYDYGVTTRVHPTVVPDRTECNVALVNPDATEVVRKAFFSQDVFEEEREKIFKHSWQFIAHESEVAKPGDYVTRRLGTDPVIVTRSDDGQINVLHNSCRHRGTQLCLADMGNSSNFRCSYHGWTYSNTGDLRGLPQQPTLYGMSLDRSKFALTRPAHVEVFCGLVFAKWTHDGPTLQESLGDMAWYLQCVFGKELEVAGPPVHLLGNHNWKSGAENWAGDCYHLAATHKIVLDSGVINAQDVNPVIAQAIARGSGEMTLDPDMGDLGCFQYTVDGGHAGCIARMPAKFERPTFFGFEEHLWDEFSQNLDADQLDLATRRFIQIGNVFPNFSFIEELIAFSGDDTPPVAVFNLRLWMPLSANETEILNWCLVPKNASDAWKKQSQAASVRTLSFGGMLETDDFQNWTGMAQVNQGAIGSNSVHDYSGLTDEVPTTEVSWPGEVWPGMLHDVFFRRFYAQWQQYMSASSDGGGPPLANGEASANAAPAPSGLRGQA